MNKTALVTALREHLADKEDIANEAAPGLAFMRHALVELEKPTSGGTGVDVEQLRHELASADSTITGLSDTLSDREGFIYGLLADVGLVPEVDDEPVDSLTAALELEPNVLDDLQMKLASLYAASNGDEQDAADKDHFIAAVRTLLEGESLSLQGLWDALEAKAEYLTGLEQGIAQRDDQILRNDKFCARLCELAEMENDNVDYLQERLAQWANYRNRLVAVLAKLGLGHETANTVRRTTRGDGPEIAAIDLLIRQRDSLLQHIENLEKELRLVADMPLAGWVSDAIDLAHAVRGNLAPENRVMAKAAEAIILQAPGVRDG